MVADPIFLAVRPEIVPESYFTGPAGACAGTEMQLKLTDSARTKNYGMQRERNDSPNMNNPLEEKVGK
jgi:hypothetical protein